MPAMVEYVNSDSFVHKLNPLTKIAWSFGVIAACFILEEPAGIFLVLLSNLAAAAAGKVIANILPIMGKLSLFALLLVLFQIFFVTDGSTLFYVLPFIKAGKVTDLGARMSAVMSLRMLATISTIPILMMTTPMTDIVAVLVEKVRLPFKYAFMFTTALRFIPAFMEQMGQILQAQMSRGYSSDTRNPFKKLMLVVPLAVPLLVSSIKKTESIAISMEVRGFGAGARSHYRSLEVGRKDRIAMVAMCMAIVLLLTLKLY